MFHLPLPTGNRLAFTFSQWVDVENHLHGISGCRMTASYSLFHVIPDTGKGDADGCASSNVNFRHTCLSPRYFWLACPLGESVCCFFPQSSRHSWMGDHEVCITRWKKEEEEEGWREGGTAHGERGKGLAPTQRGVGTERGNQRCLSPVLRLM